MAPEAREEIRKLRVLLVEDDEDDYVITRDLLSEIEGSDFDLEWAATYEAAVEALGRERYDVCLLDYRLGAQSGLEVLQEAISDGCQTPIIVLTGTGSRVVDLAATEGGAVDYLIKGQVEPSLLDRSIRYAIARRRSEEELYEAVKRFQSAFDDAPIGMALVGLEGSWLRVNRSLCDIVGYTEEELLSLTFQKITHPEDLDTDLEQLRLLSAGEVRTYQTEKRYLHKDGSVVWIMLSVSLVSNASGEPLYFLSQIQDITGRKELDRRLEHEATHDPLTSLPNRALFMENLKRALARANRHDGSIAVLFLDLDGFKIVNDSLGHEAGDALLVSIARRLRDCLRAEDTVARLGGDEFAILLEDVTNLGQPTRVAGRIVQEFRTPFDLGGHVASVGISVGICASTPGYGPEDLLRNADTAMYRAKNTGESRYEVF